MGGVALKRGICQLQAPFEKVRGIFSASTEKADHRLVDRMSQRGALPLGQEVIHTVVVVELSRGRWP